MMLITRETAAAPAAVGPYAQSVLAGQMLFISGQIPLDPKTGQMVAGGIKEQAARVMENLLAILKEYDADFSFVAKATCFLTDMSDFAEFNEVYARYMDGHKPARVCVAVRELPKGAICEVEVIAML